MSNEKSVWKWLCETNRKAQVGVAAMALGLMAMTAGAVLDISSPEGFDTHQLNNADEALGLVVGGGLVLLAGQQGLIRGARQERSQNDQTPIVNSNPATFS